MSQALEQLQQIHAESYNDMSFDDFKEAYRQKFYSDLSAEDFNKALTQGEPTETQAEPVATPQPVAQQEAQGSTLSYLLDQAKVGLSEFATGLIPNFDMLTTDITQYGDITKPENAARFEADALAKREELQRELFGVEGIQPRSEMERTLGAGVRATAAEGPLAVVGARGPISALGETAVSVLSGAAGQYGAEQAGAGAEALGLPEQAVQAAQIVGGTALGATPATATSASRGVVTGATQGIKAVRTKRAELKKTVDGVSNYVADQRTRAVINNALTAKPDTPAVIEGVKELSRVLPNVEEGQIPPFIALQTNPVFKQNFEYLIRKSPTFRAEAEESVKTLSSLVDQRQAQLFGKGGAEAESQILQSLPKDYTSTIKQATTRLDNIDLAMQKLTATIKTPKDAVDIGTAAEGLMKAKEQAVRAKLTPQYDKLLNDAELAGIQLPGGGRREIYNFVKAKRIEEVFQKFPTIYNKINTQFRPKRILDPTTGKPRTVFEPVNIKQVDSLKRAINEQLRKRTLTADETRLLNDLKAVTTSSIERMPEDFVDSYTSLDRQYYQELGIPFSTSGARQFDSAKFSSQVGTYLTKPEQALDFLKIAGDDGLPIVRDAILLKMQEKVMSDDVIDLRKYSNFIKANERLINTVPGLRQELSDVGNAMRQMEVSKATLDSEYTIRSRELTEGLYKRLNERGLDGVVNDILSSPAKANKYLADIKNFTPETAKIVRKGIQSAMFDKARNTPGVTMLDFMAKHEAAFSKVYGSQYLKSVKSLGQLSDLLKNVDPDAARFATTFKNADQLETQIGISAPQLQSILRDRITNVGTKLAIIFSKINSSQVVAKQDAAMRDLLMNPDALETLRVATEQSQVSMSPKLMKTVLETLSASINSKAVIALEAAEQEIEQPLSQTVINYDY